MTPRIILSLFFTLASLIVASQTPFTATTFYKHDTLNVLHYDSEVDDYIIQLKSPSTIVMTIYIVGSRDRHKISKTEFSGEYSIRQDSLFVRFTTHSLSQKNRSGIVRSKSKFNSLASENYGFDNVFLLKGQSLITRGGFLPSTLLIVSETIADSLALKFNNWDLKSGGQRL